MTLPGHIRFFLPGLALCFNTLYGQSPKRETFLTGGINVGIIGWSPSRLSGRDADHFKRTANSGIGLVRNNEGKRRPRIIANTSIGLHAGFMWKDKNRVNLNGLQLEFQSNKACYSFDAPFQYTYKGDTLVKWVDADNYFKYSLSLLRTWDLSGSYQNEYAFWYTKLSFGQTFHHTSFGDRYDMQEDWTENGTGMRQSVVSLSETSFMISPEIGRRFLLANDNLLDVGIVYHQPFTNTRVIEYEFFKQGNSLGKSRITYFGSTVMCNVSYTFVHKLRRNKPLPESEPQSEYAAKLDSVERSVSFNQRKLNGRRYKVQETIAVTNSMLTLLVWDKNRVDGDEISLYLNGELVLENYTVSKTKKSLVVSLQPGSNILVMEALNLGRVPPNTAAISIDDGVKKKIVTLVSDLKQSGALEIIYEP